MAHIVDRYRDQITQLAQRKELVRARKAAFDEFKDVTQRNCDKLGVPGNTIVDAEPAHDLLQEMHSEIVTSLESLVTGCSVYLMDTLGAPTVTTLGQDSSVQMERAAHVFAFQHAL
ncbi:MAG TPA: hypothetical protein VEQ85_07700, partial [Lacipirellulaceae bacterium]|nr:hypothetical protein [Lacipirellulaceae bacterium]